MLASIGALFGVANWEYYYSDHWISHAECDNHLIVNCSKHQVQDKTRGGYRLCLRRERQSPTTSEGRLPSESSERSTGSRAPSTRGPTSKHKRARMAGPGAVPRPRSHGLPQTDMQVWQRTARPRCVKPASFFLSVSGGPNLSLIFRPSRVSYALG